MNLNALNAATRAFLLLWLTVTVGEVDEAAGTGVAVFSGVVWFAETAAGQILAGTVCKLWPTVAACRGAEGGGGRGGGDTWADREKEREQKCVWQINNGYVICGHVIWQTAVTHVSRPAGTRWGGQVTCSRWGCSAHSWLQWCDAAREEFPLHYVHFDFNQWPNSTSQTDYLGHKERHNSAFTSKSFKYPFNLIYLHSGPIFSLTIKHLILEILPDMWLKETGESRMSVVRSPDSWGRLLLLCSVRGYPDFLSSDQPQGHSNSQTSDGDSYTLKHTM